MEKENYLAILDEFKEKMGYTDDDILQHRPVNTPYLPCELNNAIFLRLKGDIEIIYISNKAKERRYM